MLSHVDSARLSSLLTRPLTAVFFALSLACLAVTAQPAPDCQKINQPNHVLIDATTPNPAQALVAALSLNYVIVELCNVDLDLTGQSIEIGDGVSLIASRDCARSPTKRGPRIFIRDRRAGGGPFVIRGDNVLFSGFRLQGPTSTIGAGDNTLERGIRISPFDSVCRDVDGRQVCEATPICKIEISNMEFSNWSGAAIEVMDNQGVKERGRLFNTNVGAVQIHNNYFHHNRHGDGYGYGVAVTNGSYALIERNAFDENRHAIMGGKPSNRDPSGYTARENLILEGGGKHCSEKWYSKVLGALIGHSICWQTHQIDQHGNKDRLFLGDGCCGIAGETIIIERNSILYNAGKAIKIRGNPADKAVVDGNFFRHKSRSDAIAQNGDPGLWGIFGGDNINKPIDVRPNNVFGSKSLGQVNRFCDFDGDSIPDLFMATGLNWWVYSIGVQQWYYWNTMSETLSQVQLADFDHDGKCDVGLGPANPAVPPQKYSRNGTGPWIPFIAGNQPVVP